MKRGYRAFLIERGVTEAEAIERSDCLDSTPPPDEVGVEEDEDEDGLKEMETDPLSEEEKP